MPMRNHRPKSAPRKVVRKYGESDASFWDRWLRAVVVCREMSSGVQLQLYSNLEALITKALLKKASQSEVEELRRMEAMTKKS